MSFHGGTYPPGSYRYACDGDNCHWCHPELYAVWEHFEPSDAGHRHTVVTDPMAKDDADEFARVEAPYFAGRLEVAPARPEDLAGADEQAGYEK